MTNRETSLLASVLSHSSVDVRSSGSWPGRASSGTQPVCSSRPLMAPGGGEGSACSCGRKVSSGVCSSLWNRKGEVREQTESTSQVSQSLTRENSIASQIRHFSNLFVDFYISCKHVLHRCDDSCQDLGYGIFLATAQTHWCNPSYITVRSWWAVSHSL